MISRHYFIEFVFTKHAVIHKYTCKALPDGSMQKNRSHRTVNAAAKPEHNLIVAKGILQLINRSLDKRSRTPILFTSTNVDYEIT